METLLYYYIILLLYHISLEINYFLQTFIDSENNMHFHKMLALAENKHLEKLLNVQSLCCRCWHDVSLMESCCSELWDEADSQWEISHEGQTERDAPVHTPLKCTALCLKQNTNEKKDIVLKGILRKQMQDVFCWGISSPLPWVCFSTEAEQGYFLTPTTKE